MTAMQNKDNVSGILQKAHLEAKDLAKYYFKKEGDNRKQALITGFNDGVKWLLRLLTESKLDNSHIIANDLRNEGYSIRKIAKIMGYKHPGSVSHLLKKYSTKNSLNKNNKQ